MGRRHAWRALDRIISSKTVFPVVYYAIVTVFVTTIGIHMTWDKHRFTGPERLSIGVKEIANKIATIRYTNQNSSIMSEDKTLIQQKYRASTKAKNLTGGDLLQLDSARNPILVILVSSTPRSGSSFLGELLSSPQQSLYLFEPFWYYASHKRHILKHIIDTKADKLVKRELRSLLECRLSDLPDMFDSRLGMSVWRKPLIMVPLKIRQRTSACHELKLRVIKVVRPKLSSVLPLLEDPELNVHILQLVRDPRGIVNSVSDVEGWSKHLTPTKACTMIRNDIEASLAYANHPRLLRVRYEDLVARPLEEARRMFTWMGLELPAEVPQFLDLHTRQTRAAPAASATVAAENSTDGSNLPAQESVESAVPARDGASVTSTTGSEAHPGGSTAAPNMTPSDQNVTSLEETKATEPTISPEEFKNYYGTIRDANFDGLHWLKDLNPVIRKEAEGVCADVLDFLNYPLVYPQEKLIKPETPGQ